MRKRLLYLCFLLAALFALALPAHAAGSSIATATPLSIGTKIPGTINKTDQNDIYKVTLTKSGNLKVNFTAQIPAIEIALYDPDGDTVWGYKVDANRITGQGSLVRGTDLNQGTYYIGVSMYNPYDEWIGNFNLSDFYGNYSLSTSFEASSETFAEPYGGNNNTLETADAVKMGVTYRGELAWDDDEDFYTFNLAKSGALKFNATAKMENIKYHLYDASGTEVWSTTAYSDSSTGQSVIDWYIDLTSGKYYLAVTRDSAYGNYYFKLAFQDAKESFAEKQGGSNNTTAAASAISMGKTYTGQLARNDERDIFRFSVGKKDTVHFYSAAGDDIIYEIWDKAGNRVGDSYYANYQNYYNGSRLDLDQELAAGTYYFVAKLRYSDVTGPFTFRISSLSTAYEAPKLTKVENVANGIKIAWGEVSGAPQYRVFYKTGGGSWKKLADTTATSYTWTKARNNTKYAFTVRCLSSNGKSYTSTYNTTGKSITFLSAPKVTKLSASANSVKVTWGKVKGAAKYRVYYKTGSSGWKKLADTTKTSYTWTKAKANTKYAFTVRCISKDGKSYTSGYNKTGKSIKTQQATPKLTKVENTASGVKVTWGKVSGAAKYRVFYRTGKGGWKKLADTTKTSYTWKKAKSGTRYAFTVRCLSANSKSYTSAYNTTGKGIIYLSPVKLKVAKASKGVKLTWTKSGGATGYYVYRKTGNGSYQKIATVKKAVSVTYTDKTAKAGKTYTYAVRAYKSGGYRSGYTGVKIKR